MKQVCFWRWGQSRNKALSELQVVKRKVKEYKGCAYSSSSSNKSSSTNSYIFTHYNNFISNGFQGKGISINEESAIFGIMPYEYMT